MSMNVFCWCCGRGEFMLLAFLLLDVTTVIAPWNGIHIDFSDRMKS